MILDWIAKKAGPLALIPFILFAYVESASANETEQSDFTEEDIFIDIPQVFSATRQTQKLTEAPAAITIISEQDIQAIGALKVADILRMVPGMQSYHVIPNRTAASYHGMSNDHPGRMEVMINGHSVYLPLLSTVAWETIGISIEDIDHIEIVRGSNAAAYGSNAFLGAINIVTKNPISEDGSQLSLTMGALNTRQINLSHSETSDALAYRISSHFEENDGYHLYDDGALSRVLNLSGTYTPTFTDTIDFNIGLSSGFVNLGQADNPNNNFSPRKHQSNFQHIRWNRIINDHNEMKISFTHNYLNLDEKFTSATQALIHNGENPAFAPLLAPIQPLGTEHGTMDLYDFEIEHRAQLNSYLSSVWGAGYRREEAESQTLLLNRGTITEDKWRLFGNIQWNPIDPLSINAGGMFEHTSMAASHFSPRLAANYTLSNSSSLRASATQAYRTPSLLEVNSSSAYINSTGGYFDLITQPNTDLKPERLRSYELGYFQQWPQNGSLIDIRVFNERVSNGVDSFYFSTAGVDDLNDGYRISANAATWHNIGAEFQFKLKLSPEFSMLTNYSYLNSKGVRDRGSKLLDGLEDRTPMHTASMLIQWNPTPDLTIGAAQYFTSGAKWLEGGYREQYRRTDLTVNNTFQLQGSTLNARLIVQNLLDQPYQEFYEYNVFDRRAYLQLQLEF
jgi:iron complex outermembrane receptor protein